MQISNYLNPESILFLPKQEKDQILNAMCQHAAQNNLVPSFDHFYAAIQEREGIMSTGIGLQVAVPHAKLSEIPDFFVIPAVIDGPVAWDSIDKQPIRLVFMIGGPSDRQTDYLKILSKITLVIKNANRREALLQARDAASIIQEFQEL